MPGIPLLNLGYGLGGLVQGYQNQQSQGLQQALQRLALQQAQSQSNAQTLAGLALQAGLLNNPTQINPLSPINNAATGPQASGAPAVPQAPVPTPAPTPVAPQQTSAPQQTYTPPSPFSLGEAQSAEDYPPIYGPGPGQPNISPTPAPQQQQPATPTQSAVAGLVRQGQPVPADQSPTPPAPGYTYDPKSYQWLPPSSQNGDDSSSAPAPQQPDEKTPSTRPPGSRISQNGDDSSSAPSPSGGGGGGVAAVFPNGQSIDISSMFRTIDYQKLAQGVARLAPPGTSQADIYAAVLDLGKLAEGDKVQQQQAGLIARTLLGGQFKLAQTGMTTAAAQQRVDTQQTGATTRERESAASRERVAAANRESREKIAADAQQLRRDAANIRNANDAARIAQSAQRIAISAQNAGRQEIALQISSLSRQMTAIKPQPDGSYTDQQQQQLQIISQRIANFAAQAAANTAGGQEAGP